MKMKIQKNNLKRSPEVSEILLNATNGHDALRKIFYFKKACFPQLSISYILKNTSIRSRGYVSEVLNGKKKLNHEYLNDFIELFNLSPTQKHVFTILFQLENITNEKETLKKQSQLRNSRRILSIETKEILSQVSGSVLLSLEIYSYITMTKKNVTITHLFQKFNNYNKIKIESALGFLIRQKFLQREKDFISTAGESFFISNNGDTSIIKDFLKETITHAFNSIEPWGTSYNLSHFESTIITANRLKYQKKLGEISHSLISLQEEIEDTDNPDMLVRFNVQIYPFE